MNVFSSAEFLNSYWSAFGDGSDTETGTFEIEGQRFRLLMRRGKPVARPVLTDFLEPIEGLSGGDSEIVNGHLKFLPRVVTKSVETPDGCPMLDGKAVAPFVDWARVSDPAALEAHVKRINPKRPADSRRQLRRLERDVGHVEYSAGDCPPSVLDSCLAWKVEQHPSLSNLVKDSRQRQFIEGLLDVGVAEVSALHAGGTLLAAHVGLHHEGRRYYWIPSYDPQYARYSPGRLLLEWLLLESQRRGDREFDLLIGNEPYKWDFATGARLVEPLGRKPYLEAAVERARSKLRLGRKLNAVKRAVRRRTVPTELDHRR